MYFDWAVSHSKNGCLFKFFVHTIFTRSIIYIKIVFRLCGQYQEVLDDFGADLIEF